MHQLAALYNPREKLHQSTFKHTRLTVAYRSLGDLLQLLITLDGVIARNEALHGAWNEYKRMMQYVRARPDEFELGAPGGGAPLDEEGEPPRRASRLEKFERLLVHLDKTVMASACFRGCIEQDFEEVALAGSETAGDDDADAALTVAVRSNALLGPARGDAPHLGAPRRLLGTPNMTTEPKQLVGVYELYAFYRRLTRPTSSPTPSYTPSYGRCRSDCRS